MRVKMLGFAALLGAAMLVDGPGIVMAQQPPTIGKPAPIVYRREVFRYGGTARRNPFRSLLNAAEMGVRVEDLTLRGVIFNRDPRQSLAVLQQTGVPRPIRVRIGDQIGGMRVVAIYPNRVDVAINEFGVVRRESLFTKAPTSAGRGE